MIPARALIDGRAVARLKVDQITYYHVELERHDIVLAESRPVESDLDTGNRDNFANGGGATTAHPNFGVLAWETEGCAPLVLTGPKVDAVRARIAVRHSAVQEGAVQEGAVQEGAVQEIGA